MRVLRTYLKLCFSTIFMSLTVMTAQAEGFPERPLRIVVPFSAGGAVDSIARLLSKEMSSSLGQPVMVDNKPGGGAVIGTNFVAKAPPDGYTMLLTANPHTVNASLMESLPYDPIGDFIPVTLAGITPMFVVTHASLPVQSLRELIEVIKQNPGKYNYSSSGIGGPQHLVGEMFKSSTGTSITHVPYKGAAPAAAALISGEVQMAFSSPANVLQHVRSGDLKMHAVSTSERSSVAPELPTIAELLGQPDFDMAAWMGLFLPADTPQPVVDKLHAAAVKALSDESVRRQLQVHGIEAVSNSPQEFKSFITADLARSQKVVDAAGLKAN